MLLSVIFWGCSQKIDGSDQNRITTAKDEQIKKILDTHTGNSFYVKINGSDTNGDGTSENPWRSLNYALENIPPNEGHTLELDSQEYSMDEDLRIPPGVNLRGQGIEMTSINVERVWLVSEQASEGMQTLSNLTFSNLRDRGVVATARHHIIVHDVHFKGNSEVACLQITAIEDHGEENQDPPSFYLKGIHISNSRFEDCARNNGNSSSGALEIGHTEGARLHDLTVIEDEGYGIKLKQGGWHKGIKVFDNQITVNETSAGQWGAAIGIELWRLFDDSEVYNNHLNGWISLVYGNKGNGTRSVRAHHNTIIFEDPTNSKEAFEVAHTLSDVEIDHNFVQNKAKGSNKAVAMWGYADQHQSNIWIHHNIFMGSDTDGIVVSPTGYNLSNVYVYNNVFDDWGRSVPSMGWRGRRKTGRYRQSSNF